LRVGSAKRVQGRLKGNEKFSERGENTTRKRREKIGRDCHRLLKKTKGKAFSSKNGVGGTGEAHVGATT